MAERTPMSNRRHARPAVVDSTAPTPVAVDAGAESLLSSAVLRRVLPKVSPWVSQWAMLAPPARTTRSLIDRLRLSASPTLFNQSPAHLRQIVQLEQNSAVLAARHGQSLALNARFQEQVATQDGADLAQDDPYAGESVGWLPAPLPLDGGSPGNDLATPISTPGLTPPEGEWPVAFVTDSPPMSSGEFSAPRLRLGRSASLTRNERTETPSAAAPASPLPVKRLGSYAAPAARRRSAPPQSPRPNAALAQQDALPTSARGESAQPPGVAQPSARPFAPIAFAGPENAPLMSTVSAPQASTPATETTNETTVQTQPPPDAPPAPPTPVWDITKSKVAALEERIRRAKEERESGQPPSVVLPTAASSVQELDRRVDNALTQAMGTPPAPRRLPPAANPASGARPPQLNRWRAFSRVEVISSSAHPGEGQSEPSTISAQAARGEVVAPSRPDHRPMQAFSEPRQDDASDAVPAPDVLIMDAPEAEPAEVRTAKPGTEILHESASQAPPQQVAAIMSDQPAVDQSDPAASAYVAYKATSESSTPALTPPDQHQQPPQSAQTVDAPVAAIRSIEADSRPALTTPVLESPLQATQPAAPTTQSTPDAASPTTSRQDREIRPVAAAQVDRTRPSGVNTRSAPVAQAPESIHLLNQVAETPRSPRGQDASGKEQGSSLSAGSPHAALPLFGGQETPAPKEAIDPAPTVAPRVAPGQGGWQESNDAAAPAATQETEPSRFARGREESTDAAPPDVTRSMSDHEASTTGEPIPIASVRGRAVTERQSPIAASGLAAETPPLFDSETPPDVDPADLTVSAPKAPAETPPRAMAPASRLTLPAFAVTPTMAAGEPPLSIESAPLPAEQGRLSVPKEAATPQSVEIASSSISSPAPQAVATAQAAIHGSLETAPSVQPDRVKRLDEAPTAAVVAPAAPIAPFTNALAQPVAEKGAGPAQDALPTHGGLDAAIETAQPVEPLAELARGTQAQSGDVQQLGDAQNMASVPVEVAPTTVPVKPAQIRAANDAIVVAPQRPAQIGPGEVALLDGTQLPHPSGATITSDARMESQRAPQASAPVAVTPAQAIVTLADNIGQTGQTGLVAAVEPHSNAAAITVESRPDVAQAGDGRSAEKPVDERARVSDGESLPAAPELSAPGEVRAREQVVVKGESAQQAHMTLRADSETRDGHIEGSGGSAPQTQTTLRAVDSGPGLLFEPASTRVEETISPFVSEQLAAEPAARLRSAESNEESAQRVSDSWPQAAGGASLPAIATNQTLTTTANRASAEFAPRDFLTGSTQRLAPDRPLSEPASGSGAAQTPAEKRSVADTAQASVQPPLQSAQPSAQAITRAGEPGDAATGHAQTGRAEQTVPYRRESESPRATVLAHMEEAARRTSPGVLASPSNPSGASLTQRELTEQSEQPAPPAIPQPLPTVNEPGVSPAAPAAPTLSIREASSAASTATASPLGDARHTASMPKASATPENLPQIESHRRAPVATPIAAQPPLPSAAAPPNTDAAQADLPTKGRGAQGVSGGPTLPGPITRPGGESQQGIAADSLAADKARDDSSLQQPQASPTASGDAFLQAQGSAGADVGSFGAPHNTDQGIHFVENRSAGADVGSFGAPPGIAGLQPPQPPVPSSQELAAAIPGESGLDHPPPLSASTARIDGFPLTSQRPIAHPSHAPLRARSRLPAQLPLAQPLRMQPIAPVSAPLAAQPGASAPPSVGAAPPRSVTPMASSPAAPVIQRTLMDENDDNETLPIGRVETARKRDEPSQGAGWPGIPIPPQLDAPDVARAIAGAAKRPESANGGKGGTQSRSRGVLPLASPSIQRKPAPAKKTDTPQVSHMAAYPFIQRANTTPTATTVEVTTGADNEGDQEKEEGKTGNREQLLNDLARQVYPLIKRLIALERERRPLG